MLVYFTLARADREVVGAARRSVVSKGADLDAALLYASSTHKVWGVPYLVLARVYGSVFRGLLLILSLTVFGIGVSQVGDSFGVFAFSVMTLMAILVVLGLMVDRAVKTAAAVKSMALWPFSAQIMVFQIFTDSPVAPVTVLFWACLSLSLYGDILSLRAGRGDRSAGAPSAGASN